MCRFNHHILLPGIFIHPALLMSNADLSEIIDNFNLNWPHGDLENPEDISLHKITPSIYVTPADFSVDKPSCAVKTITSTDLSVIHMNCRSIENKKDNLINILDTFANCATPVSFQFVGVTETWLSRTDFSIPSYKFVSIPYKRGGGIGMFVRNDMQYQLRDDLSCITDSHEMLFVESESDCRPTRAKNCIIGVIYRRHVSQDDFLSAVDNVLDKIYSENKNVILMGDFNSNLLHLTCDGAVQDLYNTLVAQSLTPQITKPTRITEKSATLIDHIWSNIANKARVSACVYTEFSDHLPVCSIYNTSVKYVEKTPLPRRSFSSKNVGLFKSMLEMKNWNCVLSSNDCNEAYDMLYGILHSCFEECFRLKTPTSKKMCCKNEWMTPGLLVSSRIKDKMYSKYLKCKNVYLKGIKFIEYKEYRNIYNSLIRKTKKLYYLSKFDEANGDIKKTWEVIKSVLGSTRPQTKINEIHHNDKISKNDLETADLFNEFFTSIAKETIGKIGKASTDYSRYLGAKNVNSIFLIPTDETEILNIISKLSNKKSAGLDEISPNLLKSIAHIISKPLCHIANLMLSSGKFIDNLKHAKVVPIYKKNDPSQAGNYRPISLLCTVSKVMERLIYNRLSDVMCKFGLLYPNQYGFRNRCSTQHAILEMSDRLRRSWENNETPMGIFIDLSKAFDCIDHSILLAKLEHIGIRDVALNLISSYLSKRKQLVDINGSKSNFLDVTIGVPQGSILGPLLFLIYINDLVQSTSIVNFIMFADDTSMLYNSSGNCLPFDSLNEELDKVSDWFAANGLLVNASKSNVVIFKLKNKTPVHTGKVIINKSCLDIVNHVNFLGVEIDSKLNWTTHINKICTKISQNIGVLNRIKLIVPDFVLRILYNSLVLPYLNYGLLAWGTAAKCHLNKLVVLQKRAVRVISFAKFKDHSGPLFKKHKILPLYDLYRYQGAIFVYDSLCNNLPPYFKNMYVENSNIHSHNTRKSSNIHIDNRKLVASSKSIRHQLPLLWNELPEDIKCITNRNRFKYKLKLHCLQSLT